MTNSEAAKCLEYIRFYMEGGECWTDAEFEAMDMAIKALRSATDTNVATKEPEIIRCRDCKFYTSMISGIGICDLACRHLGDNGFCSEAERREE